ncbi:MAG TPA: rhomboid family intramembrane serine protease [Kofleriaceae bacterium]|jgi:membrane associated rhomboid family serine protease
MRPRVTYNAPVVLTFALAAVVVQLLTGPTTGQIDPSSLKSWFVAYPWLVGTRSYVGLFTHVLGHASWDHLIGNFMLILLVGPMLEERYGSVRLLAMIVVTALATGLVNMLFTNHVVLGASGVAFMMILLGSTTNNRRGEVPLTFLAVAALYLGGEIYREFYAHDQISHLTHLVGGVVGAAFGFASASTARAKRRVAGAMLARTGHVP